MATATDVSLKEASSLYPKNMVRVNYKKTQINYCTAVSLGEGTFGKVYKGWNSDGREVMAVKLINQSYLNQDFKARENLEREISILKLMKGCDNVVQIFIAAQVKTAVIITMEMCDGDLHKLLQSKESFIEKEVVDFMHQLGEGMKELRKQNIVHRDIKPQNILIKYRGQRTIFKLADFGYARHFDATRTKMMNSIVGTPLYMAPEALQVYLFPDLQAHYNDKVDVWSIGALLYKVLVGKDAFPAPSIPLVFQYLKDKQDNIAFELNRQKPIYLDELPEAVQRKLTPTFCHAITELLVGMLKFDEKERFSFPTFFEKIEDIIESKVELINLLHGTSFKLIQDPCMTARALLAKASSLWKIPEEEVVIFSTVHPKYIGAHQQITDEEFACLMEKSGGQDGHAKLYVLALQHIKVDDAITPDTSCFEPLKSALDQHNTDYLIKNMRFIDEIIYMIQCLKTQLWNQHESVTKLYQFTINETGMSSSYNQLKKEMHQTLARVSLMVEVLEKDLELCGVRAEESSLPELLQQLVDKEGQLRELEMQFDIKTISRPEYPFHWKDCQKKSSLVIEMTKKVKVGNIPNNCRKLYDYCRDMIADKTQQTRLKLRAYSDVLESTWSLYSKSTVVKEISELISRIQLARQQMFEDHINTFSSGDQCVSVSSTGSLRDYTSMLQGLRHDNDDLRKKLTQEATSSVEARKKYDEAVVSLKSSELAIREREMVEDGKASTAAIDTLCEKLAKFCGIGERVICVSKSDDARDTIESPARGRGRGEMDEELLIRAKDVATEIRDSISFIRKEGVRSTEVRSDALVKLAYPEDYKAGDIVLMTAINTQRGAVPSVLHLSWKNPHMLMDFKCLQPLGIRPGRVPQLFLARLRDTPLKYNVKDYPTTAQDIGETDGIFYRATVDRVSIQFTDKDLKLLSQDQQQQSVRPSRRKSGPAT